MALTEKLVSIADAIRTQSGKTEKLTLAQMSGEILELQPLSFQVLGGVSAPENPRENTIWVATEVPVTGWYFASKQPENMAQGEVWFSVGISGGAEFNALKKNSITVCPMSARQYADGVLTERKAKSYRGGVWVDWVVFLYDSGKEYTENSGGWAAYDSSGRFIKDSDHMRLYTVNPNDSMSTFGTEGLVDLTDVNTVCARIYMTSSVVGADLCMFANKSKANAAVTVLNSPAVVRYEDTSPYIGTTVTVKLDVGSLTGTYYIGFASIFQNDFKVMSVWME